MDIGVIGSGPAAFAVVSALRTHPDGERFSITVIGMDENRPHYPLSGKDPRTWTPAEYDSLHRQLKDAGGKGFPPPRTQYGYLLNKVIPDSKLTLYASDRFGGLGEMWSTAMFPFRERDFEGWPIGYQEMEPYYRKVADLVGVAGNRQAFPDFYPDTFVNRDPVHATPTANRLVEAITRDGSPDYRLNAGSNLLAVETREGRANACQYCGGCFYGCYQNSLFRAGDQLKGADQPGCHRPCSAAGRDGDEGQHAEADGSDRGWQYVGIRQSIPGRGRSRFQHCDDEESRTNGS